MNQDYTDIFKNRVEDYLEASKNDDVLLDENLIAVKMINPKENEKILHLCAGGINIKKYIDLTKIDLLETESTIEFSEKSKLKYVDLFNLPFQNETFDKVFVLAIFHHQTTNNRNKIYQEINRVLKPNGKFILGDVLKDSKMDNFLNIFVNKYNPNGHQGLFFNEEDKELLIKNNFNVEITNPKYYWYFKNQEDLCNFSRKLFYLKNYQKNNKDLFEEISTHLDIINNNNDKLKWKWELIYFISTKV
jgi:SAM-dependent methyltransferase